MGRTNDNPGRYKNLCSIFSGAQRRYGKLYFYDEKTGEKDCYEEKSQFQ